MARRSSSSRSRRRSSRSTTTSTSTTQQVQQTTVASTSSTSSSSRRYYRRKPVDTENWVSKHLEELIDRLGLDFLGLSREELEQIVVKLVDILRGEASTINLDTIVRRFRRNLEHMHRIIASMLLEMRDDYTEEQLEFIVNNIGDAVLAYAPKLYQKIVKLGKHDLLDRLRSEWMRAWITRKCPVLPVQCPVCGFHALMPDLTCLVCGSTVTEKQLKEFVNFNELLKDFVETYPRDVVENTIKAGYVLLTSCGIKPPSERREPLDIEVVLSTAEKEFLKKLLDERESNGSRNS